MDSSSEASSMAQGLRIVRLVADREKWGRRLLGVSQLASELDMEQSRVSRLTQELCDLGLLERVERNFSASRRRLILAGFANQEPSWRRWWPRLASDPGFLSARASG